MCKAFLFDEVLEIQLFRLNFDFKNQQLLSELMYLCVCLL